MTPEELRPHISSASPHCSYQARQLTTRFITTCWPGGTSDRLERSALDWLRHWRPQRGGTSVPVCSCASGHCTVCN
jgi:hypothetical protein